MFQSLDLMTRLVDSDIIIFDDVIFFFFIYVNDGEVEPGNEYLFTIFVV